MGYTPTGAMLRVYLPLALPSIFAGLRVATVTVVGLVTITAFIEWGGLGQLIITGFSENFYATPIIVGLVLSIVLAALGDATRRAARADDRALASRGELMDFLSGVAHWLTTAANWSGADGIVAPRDLADRALCRGHRCRDHFRCRNRLRSRSFRQRRFLRGECGECCSRGPLACALDAARHLAGHLLEGRRLLCLVPRARRARHPPDTDQRLRRDARA